MQSITTFMIVLTTCVLTAGSMSSHAEKASLMQMIAEWRYPDSTVSDAEMADGATKNPSGDRTTQSIVCKTIMRTDATVEQVLDYYKAKLKPPPTKNDNDADTADVGGRSVVFSDDSEGRPFAMHTIIINTEDTATTLIITRGEAESKTHIGWKHYRRFNE